MAVSKETGQSRLLPFSFSLREADIVAEFHSKENKRNIGIYQMTFGLLNVIDPDEIKPTLTKYGFTYDDFMRNVRFMRQSELNSPNIERKQRPKHTFHLRQALTLSNTLAIEEGKTKIGAAHMLIGIAKYAQEQYDEHTSNETPQYIDEIAEDEAAD